MLSGIQSESESAFLNSSTRVRPAREPSTGIETPDGPKDFIRLCVQDQKTKTPVLDIALDPQHAFVLAQNIITMVRP